MNFTAEQLQAMSDQELTNAYLQGLLNTSQIDAARQQANQARMGVGLGEAGREVGAALAGVQYQPRANPMAGIGEGVKAAEADRKSQLGTIDALMKNRARVADAAAKRAKATNTAEAGDPESPVSRATQAKYNELALQYGLIKPGETLPGIELVPHEKLKDGQFFQNALLAKEKTKAAAAEAAAKKAEEESEKEAKRNKLKVGEFGYAESEVDKRDTDDALIAYKKAVNAMRNMVENRNKWKGFNFWQKLGSAVIGSEESDLAQQASTELLLEMKSLASLGVLSKSDERLLNRLIPDDPTEWKFDEGRIDAVLRQLQGMLDKGIKDKLVTKTNANPEAVDKYIANETRGISLLPPGGTAVANENEDKDLQGFSPQTGKREVSMLNPAMAPKNEAGESATKPVQDPDTKEYFWVYPNGDMIPVKTSGVGMQQGAK